MSDTEADTAPEDETAPPPQRVQRVRRLFEDGAGMAEDGGGFRFGRWSGGLRPRVMGLEPSGAERVLAGLSSAAAPAGIEIAEPSETHGPNLILAFCGEWRELLASADLRRALPELPSLVAALDAEEASEHCAYLVDAEHGVRAAVALCRLTGEEGAADSVALRLGMKALLMWGGGAFDEDDPVSTRRSGRYGAKRWFANLLEAAYAEGVPLSSDDPALAERLAAAVEEIESRKHSGRKQSRKSGRARGGAGAEAESDEAADAGEAEPPDASSGAPEEREPETSAATAAGAPAEETAADAGRYEGPDEAGEAAETRT